MRSEFYIYHNKFQDLSDKAIDWLIKSFKLKYRSLEWKVCRANYELLKNEAMKHLKEAIKNG